ncbi:hypothetical protein EXE43_14085 [Halorubrum sp. SS5]|nr:hypothetical protein EXE43_14085 [Halorubrum sp. SS5]
MRNIVMVTYDSLRADHCGYVGYDRDTTPNLDDMAKDGIAFENAIAPASRTNPSMAGIFTGKPMVTRDQVSNPKHAHHHLARHGTIAETMSEQGYSTGAFCPNAYSSRYYGFDRGFDHFEDFLFSSDRYQKVFQKHLSESPLYTLVRNFRNYLRREEAFKTWDRYIDSIEEWVHEQEEPFFLWVFSLDTHFPHLAPREHREWSNLFEQYYYNWRCNQLIDDLDPNLSEKEINKIINIYDDSIRFGDVLLYELQSRLEEFDPIYVIYGDHGEGFGERGIYGHFYPSLYEENIHVPLVVSGRDIPDQQIEYPISLLNLPSLVQDLADPNNGITIPDNEPVVATDYDGRTDRNLTAIKMGNEKFIRKEKKGETSEEFYDLEKDPGETRDLAGTDKNVETMELYRTMTRRRNIHETELLGIESAVSQLGKI